MLDIKNAISQIGGTLENTCKNEIAGEFTEFTFKQNIFEIIVWHNFL